jgi:hypothetical protein
MSDDQRVYSDDEFALILRKAAELASGTQQSAPSSTGLTLSEMKAAAAQVGFDPALVERAARMLTASASASPLERLLGGPLRHGHEARFPIKLDEERAARLLSAVRINAVQTGSTDVGHSSSMGMTWHDGGETEALGVTARPQDDGTSVSVSLDRRGTLATMGAVSVVGIFLSFAAGVGLTQLDPWLGLGTTIVGAGGALVAARSYWASSTRKVRERISLVMDAVGQTLEQPETLIPEKAKTTLPEAAAE